MEACGSAHYWARWAISHGHEVKLIAPQYVKPFVKRHKTDAADAAAIVEAGTRESMNFVPIKSAAQQDIQSMLRIRQRLVESRTQLMNQIRGLLAEYGIAIAQGPSALKKAILAIFEQGLDEPAEHDLTPMMYEELRLLRDELSALDERVKSYDAKLERLSSEDERCQRLMSIPGVGPVSAASIVAAVGDARDFKNARQLAAWAGLTPKQHSTGGRVRTLGISKAGNRDLRTLLIHGGRTVLMNAGRKKDQRSRWAVALKDRVGMNKAAVAMAHKNIRTIFALLRKGGVFQDNYKPQLVAA
jgi:transposase